MAQGYTEQTENAFTHQIDHVVKNHVLMINTHINDGALTDDAADDIRDRAQTIGQLLELRQAVADREPVYVIPLVRSRCGESVPQ